MLFKTETLSVASNNQQGLETNAIARISSFRQVYCATVAKERQGAQMDIRQHKGQRIADRLKVKQKGDLWSVPSESGPTRYTVTPDPQHPQCTCPDFEFRQLLSRMVHKDAAIDVVLYEGSGEEGKRRYQAEKDRYRQFFGKRQLQFHPAGAVEFVRSHVEAA